MIALRDLDIQCTLMELLGQLMLAHANFSGVECRQSRYPAMRLIPPFHG